MSHYSAPIRDMQFVMRELAGLDEVAALPGNEEVSADLVDAILEEADKFAGGVLAPLNVVGDQVGAKWADGKVTTVPGWKEAYSQFAESGWTALAGAPSAAGAGAVWSGESAGLLAGAADGLSACTSGSKSS